MRIHIVEDDKFYNRLIEHTIQLNPDYDVHSFYNGKDFLNSLTHNPDLVTLDLDLPDLTGYDLLKKVKHHNPDIDVIVISGTDSVSTAVNLLKEGANDYIIKDDNLKDRLYHSLKNIENQKSLRKEIWQLKSEITTKYDFNKAIIGESTAIKDVFSLIDKAIKVPNINVSVYGETGTGKELIAKTIHYNSFRQKKAFVAVNMGAIPRELIESELFGHEKGAFTGAIMTKKGKFEEADGGTIFLDEIGDLDLNLQVKLLRVLQEREITRVGGNATIKVNTRIITATNKDLLDEVRAGNFREDLYYRLLGLPIHLPALKERQNDIVLLSNHFLNSFCTENNLPPLQLTSKAKKKLLEYSWPGNVRELKAVIELAAVMCSTIEIDSDNIIFNSPQEAFELFSEELTLKEYTERIIKHYLNKYNNNVLKVAEKLDIGKSTIYNLLKKEKVK